jgi:peptidoglycan hydrolase FlgJ
MNALTGPAQQSLDTWTDLSGFNSLRSVANKDQKAALPQVARQFEAIFTQMMLKSMRQASFGDSLFDSQQSKAYRDLFDKQLALSLSGKGSGIGIADMLVRQLGGKPVPPTDAGVAGAPAAGSTVPVWMRSALHGAASAARAAVPAVAAAVPDDPVAFVRAVAPYARAAAHKLGVSVRAVLAQAALETGWGKHTPTVADGASSHNLFGIKGGGSWQGSRANVPTLEYENGVAVRRQASFRAYASPAESFADYARLLGDNPRYAGVTGHGDDVAGFAHALVDAGYATDPAYARKITAIANSDTMRDALAALKDGGTLPSTSTP